MIIRGKEKPWGTARVLSTSFLFVLLTPLTPQSQSGPCDPPILNPIVCENSKPGNPSTEWNIGSTGDPSIQGFATEISVNKGETIRFKIDTDATQYRLDIYRMGYYGGMGARKVTTVQPSAALPQIQPVCLIETSTQLTDCGNWAESASWQVPLDAPSGIYFAKLVREDGLTGASHIFFVVRDDNGGSDLLFQTSDTTWQAYNSYGGSSLYVGPPPGRAFKVSYNRPVVTRATSQPTWVLNAEYPMVRWLEANGYNVSYFTGVDSARRGAEILEHRVFLSVGHDEYWSGAQRANVEAARAAGVHLAFFSGNEVFWKIRWENSIDASNTPFRTLVCYKETHDDDKIDPLPDVWTGTWRDPRFSPPADGGRPENALTGTIFMVNGTRNDAITVPAAYGKMRFWRNTSIATLAPNETAALPTGTLGYEWDEEQDNGFRPPGLIRLSSTTIDLTDKFLLDFGSTFGAGTARHSLTLYRHPSGALIFGAGTVQWSWGLDANHDRSGPAPDIRMQQATVNLFADMDVQPATLQPGLIAASKSADTTAPTSTITSPSSGTTVLTGTSVTITGTASDTDGLVGGVEVSVDSGATWLRADGHESWSFAWTPDIPGPVTLMSRAVDDSGNLEIPVSGPTVTVERSPSLVAAYPADEGTGTLLTDFSGNSNTGTLTNGPAWTAGRFGNGVDFDGFDDFVTVPDAASLDLGSTGTLEVWVKLDTLGRWHGVIAKGSANSLLAHNYAIEVNSANHVVCTVGNGTTFNTVTSVTTLTSGVFVHLTCIWDGSELRLYVNGSLNNTALQTITPAGNVAPLSLGQFGGSVDRLDGVLDEVRIHNQALTQAEIQLDMITPLGGSSTLAGTVSPAAEGAGTLLTLSGAASATTTADALGAYSFAGLPDGSYTVTPSKLGFVFTPPSAAVTISGADVSGVDFSATAVPTFSVAGTVSPAAEGAGTLLTLSGDADATTTADALGAYSFAGVPDGSYTVTPSKAGFTFTPANAAVTVAGAAVSGVDFSATVVPVPPSLVAAYPADEGTGTLLTDFSGNSNTGTLTNGPAWTAGRFGNGVDFDGFDDFVTVPDAASLDLGSTGTLEVWVKLDTLGRWHGVLAKGSANSHAAHNYAIEVNSANRVECAVGNGTSSNLVTSVTTLTSGVFVHLACVWDGTQLRLYLDGVLDSTTAQSVTPAGNVAPLSLGQFGGSVDRLDGVLDEVRIHNQALTQAQIQLDMTSPIGPVAFRVEPFLQNLAFPVRMAFAPDGRLFFNELKTGNVRIVESGVLRAQPFTTLPVETIGERGLLGLAFDPQFSSNGFVYLLHSDPSGVHRVVRLEDVNNVGVNQTVIVDNLPSVGFHNAGSIGFGSDGRLYISLGDATNPANSQDLGSLSGRILRYNSDGSIPTDNPFGATNPSFNLGLRNSFDFTFHPQTGSIYASENGPDCDDEVNRVVAGGNYGWRPSYPCGDADPAFNTAPPVTRFNPVIAPTGVTFYTGSVFPQFQNNLFLVDFLTGRVQRFEVDENNQGQVVATEIVWGGGFGSLMDIAQGTDGLIYFSSDTAIMRIVP